MNDPIVPPINGQFLADRLQNSRYMLLDAEHRYWEEAADIYIETLISWFGGDYHSLEK
jgi:pimeloyl-ACP methyl ester carboxylesterase